MKHAAFLLVFPLLVGCSEPPPPAAPLKLVRTLTVGAAINPTAGTSGSTASLGTERSYSGEVRARIETTLGFRIAGNIVVANPSTPANLFHLLRRQIAAPWRKPLFVIAPKSLLRLRACASALAEMGPGTTFRPSILDAATGKTRRLVLCSGKIAYDLLHARAARGRVRDIAILRVEQLYPLPVATLAAAIADVPQADCVWCQEEPENQGAAAFVLDALRRHAPTRNRPIAVVARPRLPVAAGGSIDRHEREQLDLVDRALTT